MVNIKGLCSIKQIKIASSTKLACLISVLLFIFPVFAIAQPTVNLTLNDGNLSEASLDTGSFTITRSNQGDVAEALTVYLTFAGSASNGSDYSATLQHYVNGNTRWMSIPANELSVTSVLTPFKDNFIEGEENAIFTLQTNADYTLGSETEVEMTISDDVVVVTMALNEGDLSEANLDTGSFTITRNNQGNVAEALTVYLTIAGSASNGSDYSTTLQHYVNANTRWLSIPANELSITSVMTPLKDNFIEGEENLTFTLGSDNTRYSLGADIETEMTISDDVVVVTMALNEGDLSEANLDTGSFTITRNNQGNVAEALTVYLTIAGSASNGSDYSTTLQHYVNANTRWLSIPANELSITSVMTPLKDNFIEGEENLTFTLGSDNTRYSLGADIETEMTISDDVVVVTMALNEGDLSEANLDTGSFTITRNNQGNVAEALTVYLTIAGSASNGSDYSTTLQHYVNANTRWLSIPANELSITSVMTPLKDNFIEGEENLTFTLGSDNTRYSLGADIETEMTISDEVVVVTMTDVDGSLAEANLESGSFTITRSNQGNVAEALTVYLTFAGSASNGSDYSATLQHYVNGNTRWMSIPANELSVTSVITPVKDFVIEGDETAVFTLGTDNTRYSLGVDIVAEMTIADLIDLIFKDGLEQPATE